MIVCTPALTGVAARSWCALSIAAEAFGSVPAVLPPASADQSVSVACSRSPRESAARPECGDPAHGDGCSHSSSDSHSSSRAKGEPLLGNHPPALLSILIRVPSPVKYTL